MKEQIEELIKKYQEMDNELSRQLGGASYRDGVYTGKCEILELAISDLQNLLKQNQWR